MDSKKMMALLGAMSVMVTAVPAVGAMVEANAAEDDSIMSSDLKLYSGSQENIGHWRGGHWSHGSHSSHGSHVSHTSARY